MQRHPIKTRKTSRDWRFSFPTLRSTRAIGPLGLEPLDAFNVFQPQSKQTQVGRVQSKVVRLTPHVDIRIPNIHPTGCWLLIPVRSPSRLRSPSSTMRRGV